MPRCPVCASRNVKKLKTGSFKCETCGFIFYPTREAIIDMRDLVAPEDFSEEEVEALGEKFKEVATPISKRIFGENTKGVFTKLNSIEDMMAQYDENDMVYGVFVDFNGELKGTLLVIIPEENIPEIMKVYGDTGVIDCLKKFGADAAEDFKSRLGKVLHTSNIDIAYDTIPSMMNYLLSDLGSDRDLMFLNIKLVMDSTSLGDIIFVPKKESMAALKSLIGS